MNIICIVHIVTQHNDEGERRTTLGVYGDAVPARWAVVNYFIKEIVDGRWHKFRSLDVAILKRCVEQLDSVNAFNAVEQMLPEHLSFQLAHHGVIEAVEPISIEKDFQ